MTIDYTATPQTTSMTSTSRKEIWALSLLFVLLGTAYASWASRIPAIRDALGLTPSQVGIVLFCAAIGAIVSFPISSWLVAHVGARRSAFLAGAWILLILLAISVAPQMWVLMICMVGFGLGTSIFDVAINMLGTAAEKKASRSIMSQLHAWFCAGTMSGALFGSGMASLNSSPLIHFFVVCVLLSIPLTWAVRVLPNDQPDPQSEKKAFAVPHGALIALGMIGFCGAIAEGSIADWSGIYLKDQLHASEGIAPLAFAIFSATMLAARLVCDRLKDIFGARKVMVVGALISALGLLLVVGAFGVLITLVGFALSGTGLAAVFPFMFSAAGQQGGNAVVSVATMSYTGGLVGPPVIGLISDKWGLQMGMAFICLLSVAISVASARAKALN